MAVFLLSITASNALTINYTYDKRYQLTGVSFSNGASIEYAYDAAGNRTLLRVTLTHAIGDVNGDGHVDLTDAILSLQVSTGLTVPGIMNVNGDINADGRIGVAEAIHAIENVAEQK